MYCERDINTERGPFVAFEYFEGVPDDKNAQSLTIKNISLDKGNMNVNKVIIELVRNWSK